MDRRIFLKRLGKCAVAGITALWFRPLSSGPPVEMDTFKEAGNGLIEVCESGLVRHCGSIYDSFTAFIRKNGQMRPWPVYDANGRGVGVKRLTTLDSYVISVEGDSVPQVDTEGEFGIMNCVFLCNQEMRAW